MNDWTWLLIAGASGILLGAILQRNLQASGIGSVGALHNQDMWYWIKYHEKQRQQQAASLQQPTAMPTQLAMQQQPLNVEQVMASQAQRAQLMQQPGLASQQQGLAARAQQNVPHYFF